VVPGAAAGGGWSVLMERLPLAGRHRIGRPVPADHGFDLSSRTIGPFEGTLADSGVVAVPA